MLYSSGTTIAMPTQVPMMKGCTMFYFTQKKGNINLLQHAPHLSHAQLLTGVLNIFTVH